MRLLAAQRRTSQNTVRYSILMTHPRAPRKKKRSIVSMISRGPETGPWRTPPVSPFKAPAAGGPSVQRGSPVPNGCQLPRCAPPARGHCEGGRHRRRIRANWGAVTCATNGRRAEKSISLASFLLRLLLTFGRLCGTPAR